MMASRLSRPPATATQTHTVSSSEAAEDDQENPIILGQVRVRGASTRPTRPPTRDPGEATTGLHDDATDSAGSASGRRLRWAAETVDNEHLGRKSSKICCIYYGPDEDSLSSSSSSLSSDSGSDHDQNDGGTGGDRPSDKSQLRPRLEKNAYERPSKASRRMRKQCKHKHSTAPSSGSAGPNPPP